MSVRVRADGRVLCAAMHGAEPGDAYIDDGLHYRLSVELKVLLTEPMHCDRGRGGHAKHGEWWWKGCAPPDVCIDPFYDGPYFEKS